MMELSTIRVIPWDIGRLLTPADREAIGSLIEASDDWQLVPTAQRTMRKDCFLVAQRHAAFGQISLSLHEDGIALFEFIEAPLTYEEIEDFDPTTVADLKRGAHVAILGHKHPESQSILEMMAAVRSSVAARRCRISGRPDWENGGLSYVFSYFLFRVSGSDPVDAIDHRLARILHPLHTHTLDDKLQIASIDLTWPLERRLAGASAHIEAVEMRPGLRVSASWSTMCVTGNLRPADVDYFRAVQAAIQHCWFFCYVMAIHVQEQFAAMQRGARPRTIGRVDQEIADLRMKLAEIRYLRSSTAKISEFTLFDRLLESSRVDALIRRIDETAEVFQERYSNTLEERRARSARVIEGLLFLFAALSAIDAYFSLRQPGNDIDLTVAETRRTGPKIGQGGDPVVTR